MPKTTQTTGTKYCKGCDTTKLIDEFYLRNKTSMVRHSTCKECDKKRISEKKLKRIMMVGLLVISMAPINETGSNKKLDPPHLIA